MDLQRKQLQRFVFDRHWYDIKRHVAVMCGAYDSISPKFYEENGRLAPPWKQNEARKRHEKCDIGSWACDPQPTIETSRLGGGCDESGKRLKSGSWVVNPHALKWRSTTFQDLMKLMSIRLKPEAFAPFKDGKATTLMAFWSPKKWVWAVYEELWWMRDA